MAESQTVQSIPQEVRERLEDFADYLVREVENKVRLYILIYEGKKKKVGKTADTISKAAGIASKINKLISPASAVIQLASNYLGTKIYEKKVSKCVKLLDMYKKDKLGFRKKVITVALNLFQSFQIQIMRVTSDAGVKKAMHYLAMEVSYKIFDYSENNPDKPLAEAALYASSKREKIYSKSKGLTLLYKYEGTEIDWNSNEIFTRAGLYIYDNGNHLYYHKKTDKSGPSIYGYRRPLKDEDVKESLKEFEDDIVAESKTWDFVNYSYIVNSKNFEEILNYLVKKINSDSRELEEVRLTEILDEIIEDVQETQDGIRDITETVKESRTENKEGFQEVKYSLEKVERAVGNFSKKTLDGQPRKGRPVWFGVREPVKSFTGRKRELNDIHTAFQETKVDVVAICGLGGIGKTELATKYCHENCEYYEKNVVWINAETAQTLEESFRNLAKELYIPTTECGDKNIKTSLVVKEVYKYFREIVSLFVFDNAEEYKVIKTFLPVSCSPGDKKPSILITTRFDFWKFDEECSTYIVYLGDFEQSEALEYVKKALGIAERDNQYNTSIDYLVTVLCCFPLALAQAVAYIKRRWDQLKLRGKVFWVDDYLKEYAEEVKHRDLLDYNSHYPTDRYNETVYTTWMITFKNIKTKGEEGQNALNILKVIAFLAADEIKAEFFFCHLIEDTEKMWHAIELLKQYSVIRVENGWISIHRLVQKVIRLQLAGPFIDDAPEGSLTEKTLIKVFKLLIKAYSVAWYTFLYRNHLEEFLMHVLNWININSSKKTIFDNLLNSFITSLEANNSIDWHWNPHHFELFNTDISEWILSIKKQNGFSKSNKNNVVLVSMLLKSYICSNDREKLKELFEWFLEDSKDHDASIAAINLHGKNQFQAGYSLYSTTNHKIDLQILLYLAIRSENPEYVREAFSRGANVSDTKQPISIFYYAMSTKDTIITQIILEEIRTTDVAVSQSMYQIMVLTAAAFGTLDILRLCYECIQSDNIIDVEEQTLIHCTLKNKDHDDDLELILKKLKEKIQDASQIISAKDYNGKTPLHIAISLQNFYTVRVLIDFGADVLTQDNEGRTLIHCAAMINHGPIMICVLDAIRKRLEEDAFKTYLNVKDKDGKTALMLTYNKLTPSKVEEILLEYGANITCENTAWYNSPEFLDGLILAVKRCDEEMLL